MTDQPPVLQIAVLDKDEFSASILKGGLGTVEGVSSVKSYLTPGELMQDFENNGTNAVFIDLIGIGVGAGLQLINDIRETYPYAPICLTGTSQDLIDLPEVPEKWKKRFEHYYKLAKDQSTDQFRKSIHDTVRLMKLYIRREKAYIDLKDVRNQIALRENVFTNLPKGVAEDIDRKLAEAEKVLSTRRELPGSQNLIHGFGGADIKSLVNETLERTSRALEGTSTVNRWILISGMGLVVISFIVAVVTQRWEAMAFGGFGMAGIIASLVTNPLKSISISARRLIQLQIAYIGFLKHLALLDNTSQSQEQVNVLEKSKQLNDAIDKVLKSLHESYE